MPRPPEVLRDRAREVAATFGYTAAPAYSASGFAYSTYLSHLVETNTYQPSRIRSGRPPAVNFWYRESPTPLATTDFLTGGRVSPLYPAPGVAGMLEVILDPAGRLRGFSSVPASEPPPSAAGVDWSPIFRAMELDPSSFAAAAPAQTPPVFADARAAWTGAYPESPDTRIRIEAAALGGRIVNIQTVEPWTRPARAPRPSRGVFNDVVVPIVFFILAGGALMLAFRNGRLGRGDRRGAIRVALAILGLVFLQGFAGSGSSGNVGDFMVLVFFGLSRALLVGGLLWLGYFALEPPVRRHSPQTLISWSRLLAGRWRDPLVARDVLAGCALGILAQALFAVKALLWSEPVSLELGTIEGTRFALAVVLGRLTEAVVLSTGILLGLFVLMVLVRRKWIAVVLVMVFFGINSTGGTVTYDLRAVIGAAIVGLLLLGLLRLGLLTLITSIFVTNLAGSFPLTFDGSAWYANGTYLVGSFVLALTLAAFWRATPVRSLAAKLLHE
jgi:hypothetical protein